jgi:ABC-type nitrate/sulfonate/bicarbonate transport system substrate-binding protein
VIRSSSAVASLLRQLWSWLALALMLAPFGAHSQERLRLGWQTPWATQGQLVANLQMTNIPALAGLEIDYVGFSYGAPLNRAALSGQVDVLLTADQPAAALIDKGDKFRIVARMMRNRTCIYGSVKTGPTALSQLQGARVFGPTGAAAERVALKLVKDAGVDPSTLKLGDLDMAAQAQVVRSPNSAAWKDIDAMYGFDPLPAVWQQAGKIRTLGCGEVVAFVVASRELIDTRPLTLQSFLGAFTMSWMYFAQNPETSNTWFNKIASLDIPHEALEVAAAVEPNRSAKRIEDVSLEVTQREIQAFEEAVAFLKERGQIKEGFYSASAFDPRPYRAVRANAPELSRLMTKVVKK